MKYPEVVKTNARYRGPMESRKLSDGIRDIQHSIETLRELFNKQSKETTAIKESVMSRYNHDTQKEYKQIIQSVEAVKGGDV